MKTTTISNETLVNMKKLEQEAPPLLVGQKGIEKLQKSTSAIITKLKLGGHLFTDPAMINLIINVFNKYHFNLKTIEFKQFPPEVEIGVFPNFHTEINNLLRLINIIEVNDIDNLLFYMELLRELDKLLTEIEPEIEAIANTCEKFFSPIKKTLSRKSNIDNEITQAIELDENKLYIPIIRNQYEKTEKIKVGLLTRIKRAL
ncbi:hypothetical protein HOJ01_00765 [bacterium]|jgi:hypothetical protein|nr:hypothetical protein [bacterium]MBT6293319.1 hypothetical protein [bacterium]